MLVPPQAAAIAFLRYHLDLHSTELANKLIREESVLIVHLAIISAWTNSLESTTGCLRSIWERV